MKIKIEKTTYKDFLQMMSKKNIDFSMQNVGRYIQEEDYIIFFEFININGETVIGCQVGDDGHKIEEFIDNVISMVKWDSMYKTPGVFKPVALIIDGEFVSVEIEKQVIVKFN